MKPHLHIDSQASAVCSRVADALVETTQKHTGDRCTWALSGGRTPRKLYRLLATDHQDRLPWDKVHIFWGDERCVPPTDAESNYAMAQQALLRHVPLRSDQIHRVPGELAPPQGAADYEQQLQRFFNTSLSTTPVFDVMLLGMGTDGHTASLFPGAPALQERSRWAVDAHAAHLDPAWRVTLTLPLLTAARQVWFVVTGADKAPILREIFADTQAAAAKYPAAQVLLAAPHARWFCDAAAAGELQASVQQAAAS